MDPHTKEIWLKGVGKWTACKSKVVFPEGSNFGPFKDRKDSHTARCTKGGARLGLAFYHHGCRNSGTPPCMNTFWSHPLPMQMVHIKIDQPNLNLRCFGHENHVNWSFYRFMLRDMRHCLQILWFEANISHYN